ncbi:MAG: DUF1217 domain-containing protein [Pelagibaca sp.]
MTFQPFLLGAGLSGWSILKATLATQKAAFNRSGQTSSDSIYFKDRFADINTPEDLVSDRRLMRVVLGAYGLSDDIENRYFIKTVMAEGVDNPEALANRLSDRRYRALAQDFDFSIAPPKHTQNPGLVHKTIENFQNQSFEIEIGKADADMRLVLGFSRELQNLWKSSSSNNAGWFQILATPPVKEVLQIALGLPTAFSQLDIDVQHERIQDKAQRVFGTSDLSELANEQLIEQVTDRFLIMRQSDVLNSSSSLQNALTLLNAIPKRTGGP